MGRGQPDGGALRTLEERRRRLRRSVLRQLEVANPGYGPCTGSCTRWSDAPLWDAVAGIREYDATGDAQALQKAALDYESPTQSNLYALGACPSIDYQRPGGSNGVKTLETTANRILAGVLLYERTQNQPYLDDAIGSYASARAYFLDPQLPLYTVWLNDDGRTCTQTPHRFYASVNGIMIEAGLELAAATGNAQYAADAATTAHAVDLLADAAGTFADLQAESDLEEPLVLAMLELAATDARARAWILRNADASANSRSRSGSYGRFFDGRADRRDHAVERQRRPCPGHRGSLARPVARAHRNRPVECCQDESRRFDDLARDVRIYRLGIALFGTLGQAHGHAHVAIDGTPMIDQTGIWQGLSFAGPVSNAVLFAWRWPSSGRHVLTFDPGEYDVNEGGSYLDAVSAAVIP